MIKYLIMDKWIMAKLNMVKTYTTKQIMIKLTMVIKHD
jgi:hypothetical protein